MEEWKQIPGASKYQVSNTGFVRSSHFGKSKLLKNSVTTKGYHRVGLSMDDGTHKYFRVHRLVAQAFLPDYDEIRQVDHKDKYGTNNHVINLRMATPTENLANRRRMAVWRVKDVIRMHTEGLTAEEIALLI